MAFDKNNTSFGMKIIIVIFAVVLVVSLCLPFFSGCSTAGSSTSGDDQGSSSTAGTAATADTSTVTGVAAQYKTLLDSLEAKLAGDPGNLTTIASLGNNYMDCAMAMMSAGDADTEEQTVSETFSTAVGYYDSYLELAADDADVSAASISSVSVDRAVCLFYTGDEQGAVDDLVAFLEGTPDYAMGWYNLGAFYEQMGDTEQAKEAYNKAVELDPDGTAGAGTYASFRLMLIQAVEDAAAQDEDAADDAEGAADGADATDTDGDADEDADDADATASDEGAADADKDAAGDTSAK